MSLHTFLMLCNTWIFCSLIYRQVRLRRREAEIEDGQFWLAKMKEWN